MFNFFLRCFFFPKNLPIKFYAWHTRKRSCWVESLYLMSDWNRPTCRQKERTLSLVPSCMAWMISVRWKEEGGGLQLRPKRAPKMWESKREPLRDSPMMVGQRKRPWNSLRVWPSVAPTAPLKKSEHRFRLHPNA